MNLKLRTQYAKIMRFVFKVKHFQRFYFGIYKRIIEPKDLFKNVIVVKKIKGVKYRLNLQDWVQQNLFMFDSYENAEIQAITQRLKQDCIIFDIGANFGHYSLYFANAFPQSKIVDFEPFSVNCKAFQKNIELNKFTNIKAEKLAIGNTISEITLHYDETNNNLGMVSTRPDGKATMSEVVKSITIDNYISEQNITRLDFVKIDVEGFELEVLEGMKNALAVFKPMLLLEILEEETQEAKRALNLLNELNYSRYFITDDGSISMDNQKINSRKNFLFVNNLQL